MSYLPEIAIVNNIEFDHADIYKDLDAIKWQFSRLMNLVPGNGRLICGIDSPVVGEVLASMQGKLYTTVETFGLGPEAKWQARDLEFAGSGTKFKVYCENKLWGEFTTKMIGEFNVRNALAVIIAADACTSRSRIVRRLATLTPPIPHRTEFFGTGVLSMHSAIH